MGAIRKNDGPSRQFWILASLGAVIHQVPEKFLVLSGDDSMTLPLMALTMSVTALATGGRKSRAKATLEVAYSRGS